MQKRFHFSMAMESPHQIQTLGKQKKKTKQQGKELSTVLHAKQMQLKTSLPS